MPPRCSSKLRGGSNRSISNSLAGPIRPRTGSAVSAAHSGRWPSSSTSTEQSKTLLLPREPGCQGAPAGRARGCTPTDAPLRPDLAAGGDRGRELPDEDVLRWGWTTPMASIATWDPRAGRDLRAPGPNRSRRGGPCGAAGISLLFGAGQGLEGRPTGAATSHRGERTSWRRRPVASFLRSRRSGSCRWKEGSRRVGTHAATMNKAPLGGRPTR